MGLAEDEGSAASAFAPQIPTVTSDTTACADPRR